MEQRYDVLCSSLLFQLAALSPRLTHQIAVYTPPKQDQAFNQGGTFVFDGAKTIFAHYDESTGAHSDIAQVIGLAKERILAQAKKSPK
jgi:hypothetical protein